MNQIYNYCQRWDKNDPNAGFLQPLKITPDRSQPEGQKQPRHSSLPSTGLRLGGGKSLDKLLRKAAKGKIDYIITKSISIISRNTLKLCYFLRRFARKLLDFSRVIRLFYMDYYDLV